MTDQAPAQQRLEQALRDIGLTDIANRADRGEFHHPDTPHEEPRAALEKAVQLYTRRGVGVKGARQLLTKIRKGEFDR